MSISTVIKSIQDIMRKDVGVDGDAQRIGQLVWMLFLKIYDDREQEWELFDDDYESPLPNGLRWRNWAADPEGITGDELKGFIDGILFPGLFARVQILAAQRENAVLVPESSVFARGGGQYVFRVIDGKAALTQVELGQRRPGEVEITQGLAAGDVVITAGHEKVRDKGAVDVLGGGAS